MPRLLVWHAGRYTATGLGPWPSLQTEPGTTVRPMTVVAKGLCVCDARDPVILNVIVLLRSCGGPTRRRRTTRRRRIPTAQVRACPDPSALSCTAAACNCICLDPPCAFDPAEGSRHMSLCRSPRRFPIEGGLRLGSALQLIGSERPARHRDAGGEPDAAAAYRLCFKRFRCGKRCCNTAESRPVTRFRDHPLCRILDAQPNGAFVTQLLGRPTS